MLKIEKNRAKQHLTFFLAPHGSEQIRKNEKKLSKGSGSPMFSDAKN